MLPRRSARMYTYQVKCRQILSIDVIITSIKAIPDDPCPGLPQSIQYGFLIWYGPQLSEPASWRHFPSCCSQPSTYVTSHWSYTRFWTTVCKTLRPMLSDHRPVCLSVLSVSVCDVGVLWPNGWTDHDETLHAGRPRPHCVRWGPSSPRKGAQPPNFRPMFIVTKRLDGLRCYLVWR